jgi:hypothetical protein
MIYLLVPLGIAIAVIWALVVFPSFRTVMVILLLIIGGSLFVLNKNADEENRKTAIKKEQERVACEAEQKIREEADKKNWAIVPTSQVDIRDLNLTPPTYGDEYRVTASVKNRSTVNISKLKMNVVAFDCPVDASNFNQCDIVGHQEKETAASHPSPSP